MNYVNLLGALPGNDELDTFAKKFFDAFDVLVFEERESSNYVDGRYFKGRNGDLIFTISLSEEEDHTDLPYWVQVASEAIDKDTLLSTVDNVVHAKILPAGFRFARMINFGKHDEQRLDY